MDKRELFKELLTCDLVQADDIPDMELYMDQVTTFMENQLAALKRHPDDKIMTKTMINNYTKNHLLPVSNKKKYSKAHICMLIMIYYMKHILTISDIQALLDPISNSYFQEGKNELDVTEIYAILEEHISSQANVMQDDILSSYDSVNNLFQEYDLQEEDADFLEDFAFILQMGYEIFLRKRMMEQIIDHRLQKLAEKEAEAEEAKKRNKAELAEAKKRSKAELAEAKKRSKNRT